MRQNLCRPCEQRLLCIFNVFSRWTAPVVKVISMRALCQGLSVGRSTCGICSLGSSTTGLPAIMTWFLLWTHTCVFQYRHPVHVGRIPHFDSGEGRIRVSLMNEMYAMRINYSIACQTIFLFHHHLCQVYGLQYRRHPQISRRQHS